jgi:hypothetical protein
VYGFGFDAEFIQNHSHHFIFMCPALAPVRDRERPLFASGTRSLRLFIWQQDLRAVVRFVHECFVFRSSLLVAAS